MTDDDAQYFTSIEKAVEKEGFDQRLPLRLQTAITTPPPTPSKKHISIYEVELGELSPDSMSSRITSPV